MKALHCIFLLFPIISVPALARILSVSTHGDKLAMTITITIYRRTSPSLPLPPPPSPSIHQSTGGAGATAFDSLSQCNDAPCVLVVENTNYGRSKGASLPPRPPPPPGWKPPPSPPHPPPSPSAAPPKSPLKEPLRAAADGGTVTWTARK